MVFDEAAGIDDGMEIFPRRNLSIIFTGYEWGPNRPPFGL
jgi:hypothetical protein